MTGYKIVVNEGGKLLSFCRSFYFHNEIKPLILEYIPGEKTVSNNPHHPCLFLFPDFNEAKTYLKPVLEYNKTLNFEIWEGTYEISKTVTVYDYRTLISSLKEEVDKIYLYPGVLCSSITLLKKVA